MSKSYKFRGEVNRSFPKKRKPSIDKLTDKKSEECKKDEPVDPYEYSDWEEEGDFEKFDRKKW